MDFSPLTLCLIPRGHVHVLEHDVQLQGWLVQFTNDFLLAGSLDSSANSRFPFVDRFGAEPTLQLTLTPQEVDRIDLMMEFMESDYLRLSRTQGQSLHHWLSLLLIEIDNLGQPVSGARKCEDHNIELFRKFTIHLERQFARHHDVGHYATQLNVDPITLARVVRGLLGKTTKQAIEDRIMLEAKRILRYGEQPIKEVALAVGYLDQFHFSKSFKRIVGKPPSVFREDFRRNIAEES